MKQFLTSSYTPEGFQDFLYTTLGAQKIEKPKPEPYNNDKSPIVAYTQIALPKTLKQDNDKKICFYAFEVKSIKAKMALHTEIKKIFLNTLFDAILAVFYEDSNPAQFRLSLITFGFDPQKAKRTVSNLKRQSFVLGENTNTRSAQEHLQRLHSVKSIEDLENIFAREPISTDFFKEIIKSFTDFAGSITFPTPQDDDHTRQFVLRMFSRILFCKFLEKKGVISPEIWDTRLSENYYHDVLKPLFFQTLNTQKDKRNYDLIDAKIQQLLQDIPYLNGGLFDPQPDDCAQVAHINTLKIPNELFKQFFEILDRYHFTIDESTPIDQEVGLDPEMLGMVFENLLSVLFTDNKVDKLNSLRKKTGSYYTPREIVSYMVKSSILEHLKDKTNLDENKLKALVFDYFHEFKHEEILKIMSSLQDFKVLDPACGSGAFPMGMLQEICSILEVLDPHAQAFITLQSPKFKEENKDKDPTYIRKLSILQNNIYGVDIQPMAIEISRLRCFLSLVCEEDKEHIAPLPNLEFKFVTANSLIPMPKNDNLLIHDAYATIKEVMEKYFISSDKEELQKKYKEAQKIIAKEYKFSPLAEYDPFNPQSVAGFFDGELMFKIKEFDCVIGNPPYLTEGKNKEAFKDTKRLRTYQGKMDFWYHFAGMALESLKMRGELNFIATNNWTTNTSAQKLRNILLEETRFIALIDFGNCKIFKQASNQTMIMRFQKTNPPTNYFFNLATIITPKPKHKDILDIINNKKSQSNEILTIDFFPRKFMNQSLNFAKEEYKILLEKIQNESSFYLKDNEIAQGIVPNPDVVTKRNITQAMIDNGIKIGDGVFVVKKNSLIVSKNEKKYLKPLYEVEHIKKYFFNKENSKQMIYTTKNNSKKEDIPTLMKHLEKFRSIMDKRRENLNKKLDFYHLHWAREERFFESGEKIISVRKCTYPTFAYTNCEAYVMLSVNIIKTQRIDIKYLTGILNSKLIAFWLKHRGKMQGNNYQIDKDPLLKTPLVNITKSNQPTADKIIALVEEILKTKEQNPKSDTSAQEGKIDKLVYALYNLTPEEIAIIEGQ